MKKTVILMSIFFAAFSSVSLASGSAEAGKAKAAVRRILLRWNVATDSLRRLCIAR